MEVTVASDRAHQVGDLRGREVAWGAAPGPARCPTPVGTRPLLAHDGGHLFEGYAPTLGRTLMGCVPADGVSRLLTWFTGSEDGADHLTQAAVDGQYAGVIDSYADQHYGGSSQEVEVFDLRTGLNSRPLGGEFAGEYAGGVNNITALSDLVINGLGDTAVHAVEEDPSASGTGSGLTEAILSATGTGVQTITTTAANASDTALANPRLDGTSLSFTDNGSQQTTEIP